MSDDPILAALARLEAGQTALLHGMDQLQERMDRRQDTVTDRLGDVAILLSGIDAGLRQIVSADVQQMQEQMFGIWKQLKQAQADIGELKADP